VSDDPEFQAYAEQNYLLADEEDNNNGDDDDDDDDDADGYFSDGPLPYNEMEEVDDEFFFENIAHRLLLPPPYWRIHYKRESK
jgi:hypothetical protein